MPSCSRPVCGRRRKDRLDIIVADSRSAIPALQVKDRWGNKQGKLLKASLRREATLIERSYFIYIFRASQVTAFIVTCLPACDVRLYHL